MDSYKELSEKKIATKMWEWIDDNANDNVVLLRDDNYGDKVRRKEWVISLYDILYKKIMIERN